MSVEVVLDSPLAQALNGVIGPKLVEVGWSTGGTENDLAEYIILMLVNGKTQEQIAAELSGDLLNLDRDNPDASNFSRWLFDQVEILNSQLNGGSEGDSGPGSAMANIEVANGGQDADMGDALDVGQANVYAISSVDLSPDLSLPPKPPNIVRPLRLTHHRPTGPKSMRDGNSRPRDRRMLGHLAKAMDRTNDSVLHKVRGHNGNERINSHSRAPPTGPRQPMQIRGGARNMNGNRNNRMNGSGMMQNQSMMMNMSPQAQMEMLANLEQQMQGMARMMQMANGFGQQQAQRPLADRIQPNPRAQQNGFRKANNFGEHSTQHQSEFQSDAPTSSMDVEMSQEKREPASPDNTCKYNLSCTNKDCKFAHQSPAAPPGAAIDVNDVCSFGAACKNRKCTGRHPSPAQKVAHHTEMDCKFFPNCTNPRCPFRHPTMPLCRNGADCTTSDCKFTHSKVMCKFNPCLNAICPYKHEEGQKRGKFEDKVWIANGAKEHVSERKFVDENGEEELIKPGVEDGGNSQESAATELIT